MENGMAPLGIGVITSGEAGDLRGNLRLPLQLPGEFSLQGGDYHQTETCNIGLGGCLVKHVPNGAVNHGCVLTLFAGEDHVFSVTFDGWVVYEDERGCGIEFQSVDARDFEAFKAFIQAQAEDPEAVQHEIAQGRIPLLKDWNLC
jgi:hypothetical protein